MKNIHPCYQTIGANIRAARVAAGLTQRACARTLGCEPRTWCVLESGQQGLSMARLLDVAGIVGVQPATLLDGVPATEVVELHEAAS